MKKYYLFILPALSLPFFASAQSLKVAGGGSVGDLIALITKLASYLLYIAGVLAFVMLIVGGIRYIISMGDQTQTENARKTMTYAIVGVVVCATALLMVKIVISFFSGAAVPSGNLSGGSSLVNADYSKWLEDKKSKLASLSGSEIKECLYSGKTAYFLPSESSKKIPGSGSLYDGKGNFLCYPIGGADGHGDGKCPDFTKDVCHTIWSKPANSSSKPSGGTSSGGSSLSALPQWISSEICISVDKCSYSGGTGYMCNKPCCDQFNPFFDSKGKNLCSTGGFTGKGDEKCPSLSISKCQNIWKK